MDDLYTVRDMSMAAYGYLAGYALAGVKKEDDGYCTFLFYEVDMPSLRGAYQDPQTEVPLRGYLDALKYIQSLCRQTPAGQTTWRQTTSG